MLGFEPVRETVTENLPFGADVAKTEAFDRLVPRAPLESDRDRPVGERVRQAVTDSRERFRAEDGERLQLRVVLPPIRCVVPRA